MRFHLDESVDISVASGLRRRGVDVSMTLEEGLLGVSDEVQLDFTLSQGRVLVTHDSDFLRLHQGGAAHAGIAFWGHQQRSVGEIIRRLVQLSQSYRRDDMQNKVVYL
jgi:hypothetical protein